MYLHKTNGYYYISKGDKPKHIKPLGKITKEQAEKELELFKKQLEIKSIYRTIVIDPPWPIEKIERKLYPNQKHMDYNLMSIKEIEEFPVKRFANKDGAKLFVWTTQKHLEKTFNIIRNWGFNPILVMTWVKGGGFQPFNLPQYDVEFVILSTTGNVNFLSTKNFFSSFTGERREHSRKPDEFYDIIRRVGPEPRMDIFNRGKIEGFDTYGYEA